MNHLAGETSPYLLQHAGNPVDWYPWGDEALERAKREEKPILLSVGYSACHWCHVMERECFENEAIAKQMNEAFVNIKVDREERPDIDAFYMQAVLASTGGGGWPMTVFLTPEGQAFFAGTYFPPAPRQGMQSLPQVLEMVAEGWAKNRAEVYKSANGLVEHLEDERKRPPFDEELNDQLRRDGREVLNLRLDARWGGWGRSPKFPAPSALEFLMRRGSLDPVALTLDRMAEGGMYDLVGGGFHRYSIDERWLVPHFEKMLYDNAQLATTYLHGYMTLGTERYRDVVEQTVGYMLRELQLESGGFASSQDADTDGIEGLTYTWARREGAPEELMHIFEGGRFVLRGELAPELRDELFAIRDQRPKPPLDDKAVSGWNGLTLATLAECGRVLDRADWMDAARKLGEFLLGPMSTKKGRLHRTWRDGKAKGDGFAEDYACVANGLIELHVATGELRWLEEANRLARLAIELFADEDNGGFYQAPAGDELPVRMKLYDDVPTPSANSMLAYVLLRLSRIYGDDELAARAEGAIRMVSRAIPNAADSFGWMLVTLDLYLQPPREVAIIGPPGSEIARAVLASWQPTSVIVFGPGEGVPLLEGKDFVDGKPAVYICERFACQAPVTDPAELPPAPEVGVARED